MVTLIDKLLQRDFGSQAPAIRAQSVFVASGLRQGHTEEVNSDINSAQLGLISSFLIDYSNKRVDKGVGAIVRAIIGKPTRSRGFSAPQLAEILVEQRLADSHEEALGLVPELVKVRAANSGGGYCFEPMIVKDREPVYFAIGGESYD